MWGAVFRQLCEVPGELCAGEDHHGVAQSTRVQNFLSSDPPNFLSSGPPDFSG
jgi:hypothetical protein